MLWPMTSGFRAVFLAGVVVAALAYPSYAVASRPNIDHVVVRRSEDGRVTFRIFFMKPTIVGLDETVQVAIDADRDRGTGVNEGLDYSLDFSIGEPALLTAVGGEPVESHPSTLRFSEQADPAGYGFSDLSVAFSVPASVIGDPQRFDFYVYIDTDEGLDQAPSHVLLSAITHQYWTYPKNVEPASGDAYPVETYKDGSDITLRERPRLVLAAAVGLLVVLAGILGLIGWSIERLRRRIAWRPQLP